MDGRLSCCWPALEYYGGYIVIVLRFDFSVALRPLGVGRGGGELPRHKHNASRQSSTGAAPVGHFLKQCVQNPVAKGVY
jgi:hypothetical protein